MRIIDVGGEEKVYFDEYTRNYERVIRTVARWVATGAKKVFINPTKRKISGERVLELHVEYAKRQTIIRVTDADWQFELRRIIDQLLPDKTEWYVCPKPFVDKFGLRPPYDLPNAKGETMPVEILARS